MRETIFLFICFVIFISCLSSRVLDLTDALSSIRREGTPWLVMFFAPWCGVCRRLEPVWGQVAQALTRHNVRVGRLDCTRFSALASEMGIKHFPTILFLTADKQHTYEGDRTKDALVQYALRMSAPPVQTITLSTSLSTLTTSPLHSPFFLLAGGDVDVAHGLVDAFHSAAKHFQPSAFFYSLPKHLAEKEFETELPLVVVVKDGSYYYFTPPEDPSTLNTSLHSFVNEERFATFPKVSTASLPQLLHSGKFLVLAVLSEDRLGEMEPHMIEFKEKVERVGRKKRDLGHKRFQFAWTGTPSIANSIALQHLPVPFLLVLNSTTSHHHAPVLDASHEQISEEEMMDFLDMVDNHTAPIYGGNSFPLRLYRAYFSAKTSLSDMWQGNPTLTLVLFGLPLGFLSLILYSICCADILDADEEDDPIHTHPKHE